MMFQYEPTFTERVVNYLLVYVLAVLAGAITFGASILLLRLWESGAC